MVLHYSWIVLHQSRMVLHQSWNGSPSLPLSSKGPCDGCPNPSQTPIDIRNCTPSRENLESPRLCMPKFLSYYTNGKEKDRRCKEGKISEYLKDL
ncbi:hypothetical protein VNO80_25357 [Phaseolus coccineus]|uniref:Uncharacterized protein n=1 Tax=Phaseolus coccineus TaxID=3886 RepID=A0AAN9LUQ9_PHACN